MQHKWSQEAFSKSEADVDHLLKIANEEKE
jgi:hypothetical protein